MSIHKYSRLPTESTTRSRSPSLEQDSDDEQDRSSQSPPRNIRPAPTHVPPQLDPRFYPPTPSPIYRAALLLFIAFLFWLAFKLRFPSREPQVIYADRYSAEFKYRPAASPIITEKLKNGKLRIKGAVPLP